MRQYHFQLEKFQGPLDLLLRLIDEEKLKITDISLAKVADQYLQFIENNRVPAEQISEFLVVASNLLLLKSKEILPDLELSIEEEQDLEGLKKRLEIYQSFKKLAQDLRKQIITNQYCLKREIWFSQRVIFTPPIIKIENLTAIYQGLIQEFKPSVHLDQSQVSRVISLKEKIDFIKSLLVRRIEMSFKRICSRGDREERIVSFLAILELLRRRKISVIQDSFLSEIILKKVGD